MRTLITGAAGFVGGHLADVIHTETDWQIWGTILGVEDPRSVPADVSILKVDLRDPDQVRSAIEQSQPDCIFHLAGQAYVPQSWNDPWDTYETNIRSQLNLLQAVSAIGLKPKIMVVGSNEEYGWVNESDLPINEDTPLRPNSPYSVSKIAQDFMGLQYFLDRDLHVVRVRPFNHIGPGQNDRFVAPSFAKQIVEIERGLRPPVLKLGNMSTRRDFTDVRDMCRAYILAVQKGEPGEVYNICTGTTIIIGDMLKLLLSFSKVKVETKEDPSRMRPSDVPVLLGDNSKFVAKTGWKPTIPFEKTMEDLLNYWRGLV